MKSTPADSLVAASGISPVKVDENTNPVPELPVNPKLSTSCKDEIATQNDTNVLRESNLKVVAESPEKQKPSELLSVDLSDGSTEKASKAPEVESTKIEDPIPTDKQDDVQKTDTAPNSEENDKPRVHVNIENSGNDLLYLSGIPGTMTYDHVLEIVSIFGKILEFSWSASDPSTCEVIYADPQAAREAEHYLDNAIVEGVNKMPLRATARSRARDTQLFVGDLLPSVTEDALEEMFRRIVGGRVSAVLKRDPDTKAALGYGYLSFDSPAAAGRALSAGHRMKIGDAIIRVDRIDQSANMMITDLRPDVSAKELRESCERFGEIDAAETLLVPRSYAFVRYKERECAERAKRTLDKTHIRERVTVRYAEAEALKDSISVQFHSFVPPQDVNDAVEKAFESYGNCSVDVPRLPNGSWRRVAFVTFHGEPIAASRAAADALQAVRVVAGIPVCCQWAREILPRLPPRELRAVRASDESKVAADAEAVVYSRLRVRPSHPPPFAPRARGFPPVHRQLQRVIVPHAEPVRQTSNEGMIPVLVTKSTLDQMIMHQVHFAQPGAAPIISWQTLADASCAPPTVDTEQAPVQTSSSDQDHSNAESDKEPVLEKEAIDTQESECQIAVTCEQTKGAIVAIGNDD